MRKKKRLNQIAYVEINLINRNSNPNGQLFTVMCFFVS